MGSPNSIFISYASADRGAARLLSQTLAAAGLDVWLDEEELAGGEAWDAKIRLQIRTCTYFMPVVSATTEARREGYFRREWRLAVERTLDLADDVTFLVPSSSMKRPNITRAFRKNSPACSGCSVLMEMKRPRSSRSRDAWPRTRTNA